MTTNRNDEPTTDVAGTEAVCRDRKEKMILRRMTKTPPDAFGGAFGSVVKKETLHNNAKSVVVQILQEFIVSLFGGVK